MTKRELTIEYNKLRAQNRVYKRMLKKVQQYGVPLTPTEAKINDKLIAEVKAEENL